MQFTLSELQNEIKENSNKLLKENIDLLETIQKVDENCRIDKKVWDLVIEQGWLALDVPEEDGGLGFSNTDTAILSEVLGYYMPIIPIFSPLIISGNNSSFFSFFEFIKMCLKTTPELNIGIIGI